MKEVKEAGYTYRCVNEILREYKITFVEFIAKTFGKVPPLYLIDPCQLVDEYKDTEVDKVFFADERIYDTEQEYRSMLEIATPGDEFQRYLYIETEVLKISDIIRSLLQLCLPLVTTNNNSSKVTTNIKLNY